VIAIYAAACSRPLSLLQRPSLRIDRPTLRPNVASDDHGRHAIAAACGRVIATGIGGRQRLHPTFPPSQAAGDNLANRFEAFVST